MLSLAKDAIVANTLGAPLYQVAAVIAWNKQQHDAERSRRTTLLADYYSTICGGNLADLWKVDNDTPSPFDGGLVEVVNSDDVVMDARTALCWGVLDDIIRGVVKVDDSEKQLATRLRDAQVANFVPPKMAAVVKAPLARMIRK